MRWGLSWLLPIGLVLTACSGRIELVDRDAGGTSADPSTPAAPARACVPGQSVACAGPAGCKGFQVCRNDGSRFDACVCGAPAPSDAGVDAPPPDPWAKQKTACTAPQGPAITFAESEVAPALAGRWWRCGGADEFLGHHVEFTADGHYYDLSEVNGALVRNYGPLTSGSFTVDPMQTSNTRFSIHINPDLATYPLLGTIITGPKRMTLGGGTYAAIE